VSQYALRQKAQASADLRSNPGKQATKRTRLADSCASSMQLCDAKWAMEHRLSMHTLIKGKTTAVQAVSSAAHWSLISLAHQVPQLSSECSNCGWIWQPCRPWLRCQLQGQQGAETSPGQKGRMPQEGCDCWVRLKGWHPSTAVPSNCGGSNLHQYMQGVMYQTTGALTWTSQHNWSPRLLLFPCRGSRYDHPPA